MSAKAKTKEEQIEQSEGEIVTLTTVAEYSKTAAALAHLTQKYKDVTFDCATKEGTALAKSGRAELRGYRTALEKTRVEIKAPALQHIRNIDGEAKRITEELYALEKPIDDQIKEEERRKAAELQAKIDAENARIEAEEKAKREAEEAQRAAREAEIARREKEIAEREAAQREQERAAREKFEAEQRAAREKIEAEQRAHREKIEAEAAERNRIREEALERQRQEQRAEDERLRKEREQVEAFRRQQEEQERKARAVEEDRQRKDRQRIEARARAEREQAEGIERAKRLKEQQSLDGRALLQTFIERYGAVPEFRRVAKYLKTYLKEKEA